MKTMKTLIAVACLTAGIGLVACDEDEPIAPNNMTSTTATKQTLDLDTTAVGFGNNPTVTNGGTGNGNGNGNGGGGGTIITGP